MRLLIVIISLGFCACATSALAATVVLSDGRIYSGELLAEDNQRVLVSINGYGVQLPRTMIAEIRDDDTPPRLQSSTPVMQVFAEIPPQRALPPAAEVERPINVTVDDAADANEPERDAVVQLPVPPEPVVQLQVMQTIDNLRMGDPAARLGARENLAARGDAGLAMLVAYGLYHEIPSVRTESARLLGELGGQRALKYLLEAFYAAAVPTLPPYQTDYIQALSAEIARLTGRDFSFYIRGTGAPVAADEMARWWNENYATLPAQLGEPELDARARDYPAKLADVRRLNLEKRAFGGSNLPENIITTTVVNSAEEQQFASTIPTLPRNQPFYVDRQTSTSFTPSVPKVPDESATDPIELRIQEYQTRIFGSAATLNGTADKRR